MIALRKAKIERPRVRVISCASVPHFADGPHEHEHVNDRDSHQYPRINVDMFGEQQASRATESAGKTDALLSMLKIAISFMTLLKR